MGPVAQLTLACGQTLPLTTPCLWLGSRDREECSAAFAAAHPGSHESGVKLVPQGRGGELSLLTTEMSRSIITLITLPFSSWAP